MLSADVSASQTTSSSGSSVRPISGNALRSTVTLDSLDLLLQCEVAGFSCGSRSGSRGDPVAFERRGLVAPAPGLGHSTVFVCVVAPKYVLDGRPNSHCDILDEERSEGYKRDQG